VTILDANITTLIVALVLFQFGTGPVRGFAVTLSIGIIASLFTAIFVTRIIFDYLLIQRRMKKISI
jgi:preprotein translocase subunit SecD